MYSAGDRLSNECRTAADISIKDRDDCRDGSAAGTAAVAVTRADAGLTGAVSTVKHPTIVGWKLLVVKLLTADDRAHGEPVLAIDSLGAGL